jgi:hypothetical protein
MARTIYIYIYKYTVHIRFDWQGNHQIYVIYGVYVQFWPTLEMSLAQHRDHRPRGANSLSVVIACARPQF